MALDTNLLNFATRVATQAKALKTLINGNAADLSALTTTNKSNLVSAINEIAAAVGGAGAQINDATTSTVSVWSSSKTQTEIQSRVNAVVDAAPGALDTLKELATALGDDPNFATTVTNAVAAKVSGPASAVAGNVPSFSGTSGKAVADSGVPVTDLVRATGNQTIAGTKTFSSAPVVPDSSFAISKTSGLQSALDAKATAASVTALASSVGNTDVDLVAAFEAGLL